MCKQCVSSKLPLVREKQLLGAGNHMSDVGGRLIHQTFTLPAVRPGLREDCRCPQEAASLEGKVDI